MIDLKKNLPNILKQDVWEDFMDVVTDVFTQLQTEIEEKSNYFNFDTYTDEEELVAVAKSLGYTPNRILDESLDFLIQEVKDIPFKIRNKAIYNFYDYIFRKVNIPGDVYILYKDYSGLLRAIDKSKIGDNLDAITDYTVPFAGISPILHFDTVTEDPFTLDYTPLLYLDSEYGWSLDQSALTQPTNHLAIEYIITELVECESGNECIINKERLNYLGRSVEYGRKATDLPHVGAQLTLLMDQSKFFNSFDSTLSYSIPKLKTSCSVTQNYQSGGNINDKFFSFKVGTGTRTLYDINQSNIFDNLYFHLSFENPNDSDQILELETGYIATVSGNYTMVQGISGQTISYNGVNTEINVSNYGFASGNKSISFWIKPDALGQIDTQPRLLYWPGVFSSYYNTTNSTLYFTLIGSSASKTVTYEGDIAGKELYIDVEIDDTNDLLNLYINNAIVDFADISAIGAYNTVADLYIGSANGDKFYKGIIDELRVYRRLLTTAERQYLYTSKVGGVADLTVPVYRQVLSTNQSHENPNWEVVECSIPANSVSDEFLARGDGITDYISGSLNYLPTVDGPLEISYTSFPNNYVITLDLLGNVEGDKASGFIDRDTGLYTIYFYKEKLISSEVVSTGETSEISGYNIGFPNIKKNTFNLFYTISGTPYTATDDGNGNVTGTGISSGTIDYDGGVLNITFSGSTDTGKDVTAQYTYFDYSIPSPDTDITVDYKTQNNLDLTEVGLFDADDKLIVYGTFPPTKFQNIYNHLSLQIAIKKT